MVFSRVGDERIALSFSCQCGDDVEGFLKTALPHRAANAALLDAEADWAAFLGVLAAYRLRLALHPLHLRGCVIGLVAFVVRVIA
jgi:hypothetical protein